MNELEVGTSRQHAADQSAADTATENGDQPTLAERRVAGVDGHADLDSEIAKVFEPRRRQYEIRHGVALDQTAAYATRIEGRSHGMIRFATALRLDKRAPRTAGQLHPGRNCMFPTSRGHVLASCFAATCAIVAAIASPARAADTAWIKPAGEALAIDATGSGINAIAAASDGKQLFVDTGPAWFVLDAATGKPVRASVPGHRDDSGVAAPTASATRLFVTTWGNLPNADKSGRTAPKQAGELLAVDVTSKKSQRLLELKAEPHVIAASADGKRVALGFADGTVQVIDGAGGKQLMAFAYGTLSGSGTNTRRSTSPSRPTGTSS